MGNVTRHLGELMAVDVTDNTVKNYQTAGLTRTLMCFLQHQLRYEDLVGFFGDGCDNTLCTSLQQR